MNHLKHTAILILTICLIATLFSTTAFAGTTIPSYPHTAVSSSESEIFWEGQCSGSVINFKYHNGSSDKPVTCLSVEGASYSLNTEPDANGISTFAVDTSGFDDGIINIRLWQRIATEHTEHGYATHYRGADLIPVSVSSGVASFYFPGGISEREFYNQLSLINSFEYDDVPKIYSTYGGYDIDTYIGLITAETEKIISGCRTNAEKVKAIHDWIATNIAYDYESLNSGSISHAADPIWVYANKRGVCSGYSQLARVMFGAAHIPCVNIIGDISYELMGEGIQTLEHEWNAVYFDGGWKPMDITWDSYNKYYGADSPNNTTGEAPKYVYYCASPENFSCDHSSDHITTYMKNPKDKCFSEQRYDLDYAPGMPDGVMIDKNTGGYVFVDDTLGIANYAAESVSDGKVFRMYNHGNGEHFYTRSVSERDALIAGGWVYESDGDFETVGAKEDAIPVYRMYNPNSGLHHYTLDKGEAGSLRAVGWIFEGVGFYGYDKALGKGTPLYRDYNPNDGNHNYTTNMGEHNMLVALGWDDEGIGWCVK